MSCFELEGHITYNVETDPEDVANFEAYFGCSTSHSETEIGVQGIVLEDGHCPPSPKIILTLCSIM